MAEINSVDVEKIMEEIRADIKARGLTSDLPDFKGKSSKARERSEGFDIVEFESRLNALENEYNVDPFPVITGGKKAMKRVIRHMISFQTAPGVSQQNVVNMDMAELFEFIGAYIRETDDRIAGLEKEIAELKEKAEGAGK
ncbi:MAG: hypothetical protein IJM62_03400 [Lachnospiraceae bacterium]|nr:hypothetical protein [Lachnospiraceae bacterium]